MLAIVYFHPLNLYLRESEFFGALDSMMILGFVSGFAYSTLTLVGGSSCFLFASFGARLAS